MKQVIASAVAAMAVAVLNPGPAAAQANTTFVSGFGLDSNPCTLAAPCRSFAAAVLVTNPGGQVTMLDPAGYGPVTITKAISIVNDGGGEAGINDPGAGVDAITINAGAGDVVTLRGLTLNGVGTGRHGINFINGGTLNIQNCIIRDFAFNGVLVQTPASAAVTISDTIVSDTINGILVEGSTGTVTAYLERVAAVGNSVIGIEFNTGGNPGTILATIVDSVAIDNGPGTGGHGFGAALGGRGVFTLINSKAIHNGIGLSATQFTLISKVTLAGNVSRGFITSGSNLLTFGDNYIIDTNSIGTLTPIGEQ